MHLVPILRPPMDLFARIRVIGVVRRIIVVSDGKDLRGQNDRLREIVSKLPVEVELALEYRLLFTRRIDNANLEVLSAEVSMGLDINQLEVGPDCGFRHHFNVAVVRGNHQIQRSGRAR